MCIILENKSMILLDKKSYNLIHFIYYIEI